MGLLDRQRQWEQEQLMKFAGLLGQWREDPQAAVEQIPQDLSAGARNVGAMTAGLLGDVASMVPGSQQSIGGQAPTSEELVDTFGGDREHFSYYPSMIAAPGPGELKAGAKGLLAGMKGAADLAPGGLLAQSLFHGTPHKFSKFELEKIGTGEGAQAYGHGLYFAENPKVAGSYKKDLSDAAARFVTADDVGISDVAFTRRMYNTVVENSDVGYTQAHEISAQFTKALQDGDSIDDFERFIKKSDWTIDERKPYEAAIKEARKYKVIKPQGHLYEVDIPDETIAKMLDWDAPLSEQPESVRRALKLANDDDIKTSKLDGMIPGIEYRAGDTYVQVHPRLDHPGGFDVVGYSGGPTRRTLNRIAVDEKQAETVARKWLAGGSQTGRQLIERLGKSEKTSKMLNEAGIPGIRFYDGASRAKATSKTFVVTTPDGNKLLSTSEEKALQRMKDNPGSTLSRPDEGTRNIVVFNPDDIASVKRDGELVYDTGKKGGLLGKRKK